MRNFKDSNITAWATITGRWLFRGDGTFAAGGAGCERYWTIRDGRLLIAGDDGRLTMDLSADGGWRVGGEVVGA